MENGTIGVNSSNHILETRSQSIKLNKITESRTLNTCCIYLLFFGAALLISGIIMTSVSYAHPTAFNDPFFTDRDIFRKIGPTLLGLGILCLIPVGILCCATRNSRKKYNANNFRQNLTDSIPPHQQSNLDNFHDNILNNSEYNSYHSALLNTSEYNSRRYDLPIISGHNPYHYIIEEPPPPYDMVK